MPSSSPVNPRRTKKMGAKRNSVKKEVKMMLGGEPGIPTWTYSLIEGNREFRQLIPLPDGGIDFRNAADRQVNRFNRLKLEDYRVTRILLTNPFCLTFIDILLNSLNNKVNLTSYESAFKSHMGRMMSMVDSQQYNEDMWIESINYMKKVDIVDDALFQDIRDACEKYIKENYPLAYNTSDRSPLVGGPGSALMRRPTAVDIEYIERYDSQNQLHYRLCHTGAYIPYHGQKFFMYNYDHQPISLLYSDHVEQQPRDGNIYFSFYPGKNDSSLEFSIRLMLSRFFIFFPSIAPLFTCGMNIPYTEAEKRTFCDLEQPLFNKTCPTIRNSRQNVATKNASTKPDPSSTTQIQPRSIFKSTNSPQPEGFSQPAQSLRQPTKESQLDDEDDESSPLSPITPTRSAQTMALPLSMTSPVATQRTSSDDPDDPEQFSSQVSPPASPITPSIQNTRAPQNVKMSQSTWRPTQPVRPMYGTLKQKPQALELFTEYPDLLNINNNNEQIELSKQIELLKTQNKNAQIALSAKVAQEQQAQRIAIAAKREAEKKRQEQNREFLSNNFDVHIVAKMKIVDGNQLFFKETPMFISKSGYDNIVNNEFYNVEKYIRENMSRLGIDENTVLSRLELPSKGGGKKVAPKRASVASVPRWMITKETVKVNNKTKRLYLNPATNELRIRKMVTRGDKKVATYVKWAPCKRP